MPNPDKLKIAFLPNSKIRRKLDDRIGAAQRDIKAGLATIGVLPLGDPVRTQVMADALALSNRVKDQQLAAQDNPGAAYVAMKPVCDDAAAFAQSGPQRVTAQQDIVRQAGSDFDRDETVIGQTLDAARKARAQIANQTEAAKIGQRIAALGKDLLALSTDARNYPGSIADHQRAIAALKNTADTLLSDAVNAKALKPEDGTPRAASAKVVEMVGGVPGLKDKFASVQRDARGRTVGEESALRLDVFDEHFAADESKDPRARVTNAAMRLTATLGAVAARAAKDVNDPHLEGRIGQLLIREYGGDLLGKMTGDDDDDEEERKAAAQALRIAQAVLMDDPVLKLLTGKIRPEDAVQRIRDQAELAGLKPSEMMQLLRQQFEMKVATLSGADLELGETKKDKDQGFILSDLQGELSDDQATGIMAFGQRQPRKGKSEITLPQWDGDGLALKPMTDVMHVGKPGETLQAIAKHYLGDEGRASEIMEKNRGVIADVLKNTPQGSAPDLTGVKFKVPDERGSGGVVMLDEIARIVAAFDAPDVNQPDRLGQQAPKWTRQDANPESKLDLPPIPKPQMESVAKEETVDVPVPSPEQSDRDANEDSELAQQLRAQMAQLKSPAESEKTRTPLGRESEMGKRAPYIQAPGLAQDHAPRAPLDGTGEPAPDITGAPPQEPKRSNGAINERQYAHLRMLQRSDEEDRQAFYDENGRSVEDFVIDKIVERHGIGRDKASQLIANAATWFGQVPLTITFNAASLFSDPTKDAPAHGAVYKSEVEFSRGQTSAKDVIGRDDNVKIKDAPEELDKQGKPKQDKKRGASGETLGVTGGTKGNWNKDRGENYMRWRRDKDSREGRFDDLAYPDQQIFGAVNPNFETQHGTVGTEHGKNYYGDAHFLLADGVRQRTAFCVRGGGISIGGGKSSVQRTDLLMMLHDMIKGGEKNLKFMDALLLKAKGSSTEVATTTDWEVHLYGGFDIRSDAKEMWLSPKLADEVKLRIQNFADKNKIDVRFYSGAPSGITVISSGAPTPLTLELQ